MGIKENIELDIVGKAIKPTDKPLSDEFADRVRWSALSSLIGVAVAASPMLFKKKFKDVKIPMAAFGLSGVPMGWNLPRVHNKYLEYIKGIGSKSEAQKAYTKLVEEEVDVRERTPILFEKTSFLSTATRLGGTAAGKIVGRAAATAKGTGKFIGQGLMPIKKIDTGLVTKRKLLGRRGMLHAYSVRGGLGIAGVAGAVGGTRAFQSRRKLSGQNYTTFLRNNVLAGNIKPEQLSQADLVAVRRMGMR